MDCPDCKTDRRQFLKAAAAAPLLLAQNAPAAKEAPQSETLVATLHKSLSDAQKAKLVFPFDDPLRSKVDNNWFISPVRIGGDFFTADQKAMVSEIFRGLYNPDFVEKVTMQIQQDCKGVGNLSCALFGEPGSGKFEFVIAGRHCTMRCDGDSVAGAAFGGPIFYGHQAGPDQELPEHPGNVYWYQAKRANEVFQALSGKQRETALLSGEPRKEQATKTIELKPKGELAGLPVSDMSRDQRHLVEKVLADLLMPFRKKDVDEAMKLIKGAGGVSAMSMSFYKNQDTGNDGVWDVWQLESPNMIWYFRGKPHVHVWANIRAAG